MRIVDDILFSPLQESEWKKLTKEITEYIENYSLLHRKGNLDVNRSRPIGSLTLMQLMQAYHEHGQDEFYYVISSYSGKKCYKFIFDGTLIFGRYENKSIPMLGKKVVKKSIRDLNLVPNDYTMHYVFDCEDNALIYAKS
jgi:hypothetical protein